MRMGRDRHLTGTDLLRSRHSSDSKITLGVGGAFYTVCVIGGIALSSTPPLVSPIGPILVLAGLGIALLVLASRLPGIAFAGVLALTPLSFAFGTGAEVVLLAPLCLIVGRQVPPLRAWMWLIVEIVAASFAGVAFVWRQRHGAPFLGLTRNPDDQWLIVILNFVFFIGLPLLVLTLMAINSRQRRRYVDELVERAEGLQRERAQEVRIARGAERERISRELHDVIAHSLSVMIALSDGALASEAKDADKSRHAVENIGKTGRSTLDEVRHLLSAFRDGSEADTSGIASRDVSLLVRRFSEAGLPVRLSMTGSLPSQAAIELTVYRIVQESLTNVLRHGQGVRNVIVQINAQREQVSILVEDLSQPAPPATKLGGGIVGIRERVAFLGGAADAAPRPGGGWRVTAHFPVSRD